MEHEPQLAEVGGLVAALGGAWVAIRARHQEVPAVMLVIGSGSGRRTTRCKLGHFAPSRWWPVPESTPAEPPIEPHRVDEDDRMAHLAASALSVARYAMLLRREVAASLSEVLITADGLGGSATDVMGILVHEAAHAIAFQRGIKDTSRQGRYHNVRFKEVAEELGLDVRRDPECGSSATSLSDPARVAYRDTLAELARALRATGEHKQHSPPLDRGAGRAGVGLLCECGPRHRTGRTVSTVRCAICGVCGSGVMTAAPARSPVEPTSSPDL